MPCTLSLLMEAQLVDTGYAGINGDCAKITHGSTDDGRGAEVVAVVVAAAVPSRSNSNSNSSGSSGSNGGGRGAGRLHDMISS